MESGRRQSQRSIRVLARKRLAEQQQQQQQQLQLNDQQQQQQQQAQQLQAPLEQVMEVEIPRQLRQVEEVQHQEEDQEDPELMEIINEGNEEEKVEEDNPEVIEVQIEDDNEDDVLPHLRDAPAMLELSVSQFIEKIPNREFLMDYFQNDCGQYCPPLRDMTKKFASNVLQGQKFLLFQKDVKRVVNPPRFKQFSVKNIWTSIKNMPNAQDILKYFPDYGNKIYPNKKFMMNVLNTIDPGLILKTLKDIRAKRQKVEDTMIPITEFYKSKLRNFVPLMEKKKSIGIGNILMIEYPQCNICLKPMKPGNRKLYPCMNHSGHGSCVRDYLKSRRSANDKKYLCPLRCPVPVQNR